MVILAALSLAVPAVAVVASLLMVVAGLGEKQLLWRTLRCPVCHHPRSDCTCRWR
ncbi:MAG TPA: hypothetical protein VLV46_10825 [Gaiellaceae bacterium]|nr:hypothetical protein [Gaiellaceae bacterium]